MEYPDNHWTLVNKLADVLEDAKKDTSLTKEELIIELEDIVGKTIKKMVAHPMKTSYCLFR